MKPISNTAFYCWGIRMRDAETPHPICGDRFAKLFMNDHGMEIFGRFTGERGPNVSNVARARYIDDLWSAARLMARSSMTDSIGQLVPAITTEFRVRSSRNKARGGAGGRSREVNRAAPGQLRPRELSFQLST